MKQSWELSLRIEHSFARLIVKQKKKGFLVDKKLIEKHIQTLTRYIDNIDRVVVPRLPTRCIPKVAKKKGVWPHVQKVFLKNGDYSQASEGWIEEAYGGTDPDICGMFTRISFHSFDLGSGSQVKRYLLSQGWKPAKWNTNKETGERTSPVLSGDDPFYGVDGKVGRIIAKRMKYRHRRSQLEGWLKLIRPDGRITADVNGITPTARLKHKGIANIPGGDALFGKRMREVFIVPKGYKLIGCDAASCQLRLLAHYMKDSDFTEAVLNGKSEDGTDLHSINMRIAGCKTRSDAKTLIYAILFGAGDGNLADQLGCSLREAKAMRKRFLDGMPKLKALVNGLKKVWKARGYLIAIDGRKIFVRSEHMLLVYLLQSAEAIFMKVSGLFAQKEIDKGGYDAHVVAMIHDEWQVQCKEEESEIIGELFANSMVKASTFLNLNVEMTGDYNVGENWSQTH